MAFQPVTNGFKSAIEGRLAGEPAVITQGWLAAPGVGVGGAEDLAVALASLFINGALPNLPQNYVYEQTVVTGLRTASDVTFTSDQSSGTVGGILVNADANNVTLAISFRSGFTGRSFRGRNFWPGIPLSVVANNRVSAIYANTVAGWYETLIGPDQVAADFTWGVISRRINNAPRAAGIVTPITQVVVTDTVIDSQRRRLPGRGA